MTMTLLPAMARQTDAGSASSLSPLPRITAGSPRTKKAQSEPTSSATDSRNSGPLGSPEARSSNLSVAAAS